MGKLRTRSVNFHNILATPITFFFTFLQVIELIVGHI